MNMLATARRLLADETSSVMITETGEIRTLPNVPIRSPSSGLAELVRNLRISSEVDAADIATNIANAARENTMTTERPASVSDALAEQMKDYAQKITDKISAIEADQKLADAAHSDAIAALKEEIAARETAHSDLTNGNNDRIADHRRALAGIDALQVTINPPPANPAPKQVNVARIGTKGRAIAPGAVELED